MAKAMSHLVIGVLSLIEFIFSPIYIGLSTKNVYLYAICGNMFAFLWCFGAINIIIGVVSIIQIKKFPDAKLDLLSDNITILLLIINILSLMGSLI